MGRATATDLARRGATVVIAARDAEKGRDVMTEIRTVTANTDVHFEIVDLASLKSVKKFVNAFMNHFGAPDVIINSAGKMPVNVTYIICLPIIKIIDLYHLRFMSSIKL